MDPVDQVGAGMVESVMAVNQQPRHRRVVDADL
jgi:hypothetical protein